MIRISIVGINSLASGKFSSEMLNGNYVIDRIYAEGRAGSL